MSNLMDTFGTDLSLEESGAWVPITKDIKVKVRAFGNEKYTALIEKLKEPHAVMYRAGTEDPEVDRKIAIHAAAKEILVDWEGVQDPDTGELLPFNFKNAVKILSDKRIKRFGGAIIAAAADQQIFAIKKKDDTEKNSDKSLDGNTNGNKSKKA